MDRQLGELAFCILLFTKYGEVLLRNIIHENAFRCRGRYSNSYTLLQGFRNFAGDLKLIQLCHDAGLRCLDIIKLNEVKVLELPDEKQELVRTIQSIRTLKSLCRVEIRRNVGSPLSKIVGKLGLPELMCKYLMLNNECIQSKGEIRELFGDIDDLNSDSDDQN